MNQLTQLQLPNISPTYRLKIEHDDSPESPREWDNLGTMVCWHNRYNLGDEQPKEDARHYLLEMAEKFAPGIWEKFEKWEEAYAFPTSAQAWKDFDYDRNVYWNKTVQPILDKHLIMLDLYLYDHSGITMSTTNFNCPWDSGSVGFIYVPVAKIKAEYGWKVLTKARREKIETHLRNEVHTYDNYLTGEVYGYEIQQLGTCTGEWMLVDSCWGFYSYEEAPAVMLDHIGAAYGITLDLIEHAMRSVGEWTTTETTYSESE